jgi:(4S)-4-hydroxy-5-phosphonooxypentane-2,3-dione isomerase
MSAVVLFVELEIAPGRRDDFVARARQHRENVLKNEPDCDRFDVSVPDDDENVVRLYEVYADQAAVDHHMATSYMAAYREDTGGWVTDRKITKALLLN